MSSKPICIVEGKLYALGSMAKTSGALSWVPEEESTDEPINAYLLLEENEALLIDTGVSAHEEHIIGQLDQLISRDTPLSIVFTRFEGDTLTNLGPILRDFSVRKVIGGGVSNPFDFFDDLSPEEQIKTDHDVELTRMRAGENIVLGGTRTVEILSTSLRNLTTSWVYDSGTGALFTSDAFGYEPIARQDRERLVMSEVPAALDEPRLHSRLFTKFDWMLEADCSPLIENLAQIFGSRDVRIVAPTHGRVFSGREVVDAYYSATVSLLAACGQGDPQAIDHELVH